jgi:hypothetical protein
MNDTEIKLLTLLNSYGDVIELDYRFDSHNAIWQLKQGTWEKGTNGKRGMNLTGPVTGLGLDAKDKHDADQQYNENLTKCSTLLPFFDKFEKLARCRAAHMDAGSYFKMHRDAFKMRPQMRIFIPLNKTAIHEWNFIYDDKRVEFKEGVPYVLNTRKQHGSFAMDNDIYHVLMSVYLTENNLKTIMNMLPNCKEF